MTPIKRIERLLEGQKVTPAPIHLWKHFPPYDEDPHELARKTIQFQDRFKWDFVKVTYQGLYSIQDWGSEIKWPERDSQWPDTCSGVGAVTRPSIQTVSDWEKLQPNSAKKGALADAVEGARLIADHYKGEYPVVTTIFNPLTTAAKMSGDRMLNDMRENPAAFKQALRVITDTTIDLVQEMVKAGLDGIFFASQLCSLDKMTQEEYLEFGQPYDLEILDAVQGKTWFNIMHMHAHEPMFELLAKYPVQALNWHDRLVDFKIKDAVKVTDKLLIGGVDEFGTLLNGTEEEIFNEMQDAIVQAGDRPIILAPGCCVPLNVSEDRLELAKKISLKLEV